MFKLRFLPLIYLTVVIFFSLGCCTVCKKDIVPVDSLVRNSISLQGFSKQFVLSKFGKPQSKEKYYPFCRLYEVWHYKTKYSKRKFHVAFVDGFVAETGYW